MTLTLDVFPQLSFNLSHWGNNHCNIKSCWIHIQRTQAWPVISFEHLMKKRHPLAAVRFHIAWTLASESTVNCIWDLDVKAYRAMQAGALELVTGWVQLQLTEALTVLCSKWLFSRQLSEVTRSFSTLFESPKGYAPASSKSSKPSMCQPGLNLIHWEKCLWSLYSINGIWIKKYACNILGLFFRLF